jgi:hypothetical protein
MCAISLGETVVVPMFDLWRQSRDSTADKTWSSGMFSFDTARSASRCPPYAGKLTKVFACIWIEA